MGPVVITIHWASLASTSLSRNDTKNEVLRVGYFQFAVKELRAGGAGQDLTAHKYKNALKTEDLPKKMITLKNRISSGKANCMPGKVSYSS